jgi:hypothetical protein
MINLLNDLMLTQRQPKVTLLSNLTPIGDALCQSESTHPTHLPNIFQIYMCLPINQAVGSEATSRLLSRSMFAHSVHSRSQVLYPLTQYMPILLPHVCITYCNPIVP